HGDPAQGHGHCRGDGDRHRGGPAEEKPLPCPGCEMSPSWKQNPGLHTGAVPGAGNGHLEEHLDGDSDRDGPAEEKLLICSQCGMSLTWKQNSSHLCQHLESQGLGCAQHPQHPAQAERPFLPDTQLLSQVPAANCSHGCAQDPQHLLQPPQVPGAQDPQHQPPQVPPAQRPFTCPQCGRGFGRKAHLARHLLVHSGTR
ncbi:ZNF41 protein, partial [Toxostoma redivivum]|nr:ZNF41 protein [Toxostoma redivivum]